jgi:hypothetical protein
MGFFCHFIPVFFVTSEESHGQFIIFKDIKYYQN